MALLAVPERRQCSHNQDRSDTDVFSSHRQLLQIETGIDENELTLPESIHELQMGNPDSHLGNREGQKQQSELLPPSVGSIRDFSMDSPGMIGECQDRR